MKRLVDLAKLARLDNLIRRAATGTPDELAERLEMSRSSLFELIAFLKNEMRAPIIYKRHRQSYVYSYTPKFYLGFERERFETAGQTNTHGGNDDEKQNKTTQAEIEITGKNITLDDDINFNELYH